MASLVFGTGLSTVSIGSGRIRAGPELLVRHRYSEVLRGTKGVVEVFLWRLIPGLGTGFLVNHKSG